jgi:hypothetical protein
MVKDILGHANIKTPSTYLRRRGSATRADKAGEDASDGEIPPSLKEINTEMDTA